MESVKRIEQFWHHLVLSYSWGTDANGAVVACYPEVPIAQCNHVADINVDTDEVENLLNKVTKHFVSKGSQSIWFRISPLTSPSFLSSFLLNHGFEKEEEESTMVFKGKQLEDKLNPEVRVKEITKDEIDIYNKLMLKIFEMPIEWKRGWDRFILEAIRKGAKCYLAYVKGKPVGTSGLFSLRKTGEIFSVGTLEQYRRQGIGTTLTVHAVLDSIREGNTLHILHTGKEGNAERLYRKIGFEIDHTITWFVKKL